MEFINLHSTCIFKDKSVISSVPNNLNNTQTLIICYKYNTPIRFTKFNFNKIITDTNEYRFQFSQLCQNSTYLYTPAGHVITSNPNVIPDARVRNIISKGPKYRFPSEMPQGDRCFIKGCNR